MTKPRAMLTTARASVAAAVVLIAVVAIVAFARSAPGGGGPGALALETRLLAPCCYNGTLDTHDSEIAHTLRHEIESRIASGEAGDHIEADLVVRYGPQIRALPHEGVLKIMLAAAALFVVGLGMLVAWRVRRWRRTSDESLPEGTPAASRLPDVYDARIDAELAELD